VVSDRLEERARAGFDGVDAIEAEPAFVLAQAAPSRDVGAVGAQYHLVGLDLPYCFAAADVEVVDADRRVVFDRLDHRVGDRLIGPADRLGEEADTVG
jgi:hypothetical protein